MKRVVKCLINIVLIAFFMLGFVPVCTFADEQNDVTYKALIDVGFESGEFEGWSSFGNRSEIVLTNEKAYSGLSSLKTKNRLESWSGPSLNVTDIVTPGEEVFFRAYVISDTAETLNVMATMKCIDDTSSEEYKNIMSVTAENDKWQLMENAVIIPDNATDISFYFESENGVDDFCIDDVSIYGYVHDSNETYGENGTALDFDFEDGRSGWIPRGEIEMKITDSFSYSGSRSLYVANKKEHWNAPMVRIASVVPLVNYTYSAYVMYIEKDCTEDHSFSIRLQYNLNGEEVYSTIKSKVLQNGTWSKIKGDFILPANATDVYFYIRADDDNESAFENLTYYVDNVRITDSTAAVKSRRRNLALLAGAFVIFLVAVILIVRRVIRKNRETKAALRASSIDAMTGAYNRNTYEEYVAELEKNPEKCRNLYVTACDVNFLKYINDNYGHDNGDKAIIRCAEVLLRVFGKKGSVYRIGGDEFMCFSSVDLSDAVNTEFARENIDYKGYPFSAAVGTAYFNSRIDLDGPDIKTLIARSDKAMYEHKVDIKKNVDFID